MTKYRPTSPALTVLIFALVAIGAFAAVRFVMDTRAASSGGLPPLAVLADDAAARPGSLDAARLYATRANSVVSISSSFGEKPMSGSGFVVSKDGYIITASHVVVDIYGDGERADSVWVDFLAGDHVPAKIINTDPWYDLAVLQINPKDVSKLMPLALADSDRVAVGSPVAAIGSPFGNNSSITTGIISGTQRVIDAQINDVAKITDAIQHDAAVNKGNSGGPLFNARGEVIGMNQQIETTSGQNSGVTFAVSSNSIANSYRQIIEKGSVSYAWLGLETRSVTPQLARQAGLPKANGALIASVTGPAQQAQLSAAGSQVVYGGEAIRLGDQIVSLGGYEIRTQEDVMRVGARLQVGEAATVVYYRGGERHTTQLVPQSRRVTVAN